MVPLEYIAGAVGLIAVTAYIIFGSDAAGSRRSRFSAYSDAAIPTSGLMNLGSTCFFNAVLQALASCPSFCSWIDMRPLLPERNRRFIELLKLMINDLSDNRDGDAPHSTSDLSSLLDEIRTQGWVVENSEHDAHELFQAIMNLLHSDPRATEHVGLDLVAEDSAVEDDEANFELSIAHKSKVKRRESTSLRSPIVGYTASNMTCRTCLKKSSARYDMFTSLSLTFPPTTKGMFQLEDLLKFYFLSDSLSDVNCENCSRTHNRLIKSDFLKEISLGRIPKCLCLHIQRLGWYGHHEAVKRHDKVVFPSLLDLSSLTQLNHMMKATSSSLASAAFAGDVTPEANTPEATPSFAQTSNFNWYRLVALIEHQGSESSGHFVTYRRVAINSDRWIYTSDLYVREVTAERVHQIAPYMLFYEKYDINQGDTQQESVS